MRKLLEARLNRYKKTLLKEYVWDEEEEIFDPDFSWDDEESDSENKTDDVEPDDIEDIANNKFDNVVKETPKKKKLDYEENAPAPGTNTKYRTFNKKGNITAVDTKDVFSDDDYDDDDVESDTSTSDDEDDELFIPDWDFDEDVTPKEEKKKTVVLKKPDKKPRKIDKNHISLEDELMNDEDGIEYTKPTISVRLFQKSVDKYRVTGAEFRNPYYNELFSKTVPGVHIDKNGRIYLSVSFRTPDDLDNEKFGSGLLIRKNSLAEVFTCIYILMNSIDEYYGSIFIGEYSVLFDYFCDYILEKDDDEMELIDLFIRKLREVKITNIYEAKSFIDWYDSKKDEYSALYFDKEPDKKKARHSKFKDTRQLFREFSVMKDRMKAGRDGRYIDIMSNIVIAMDYDPVKCAEYRPPRRMKAVDLMKLYVAGLILMQEYVPKTENDMKDMPVFQYFAKAALRQGVSWKDIVAEYQKY